MTTAAQHLLQAFEALDPAERREVAAEILRRAAGSGDMASGAYEEAAAEVFRGYDAEESAGGDR
jgi:hypothetical protein